MLVGFLGLVAKLLECKPSKNIISRFYNLTYFLQEKMKLLAHRVLYLQPILVKVHVYSNCSDL